MRLNRITLGLSFLLTIICIAPVSNLRAEEFRIYTTISQEPITSNGPKEKPSKVIGRSLTFFRAGLVYDYMDEVGELVIFEPNLERFTIINSKMMKATVVEFPELNQFLKVAKNDAEQQLDQLANHSSSKAKEAATFLQFQLNPKFRTTLEKKDDKLTLTLSSPQINYSAECVSPKFQELVQIYGNYADWTAQMNYILHARSFLPYSRLKLNQELKEKQLFPVAVELESKVGEGFRLRAMHKVRWQLDKSDRTRINDWEKLRRQPELEYMTFREYQRSLLVNN